MIKSHKIIRLAICPYFLEKIVENSLRKFRNDFWKTHIPTNIGCEVQSILQMKTVITFNLTHEISLRFTLEKWDKLKLQK